MGGFFLANSVNGKLAMVGVDTNQRLGVSRKGGSFFCRLTSLE